MNFYFLYRVKDVCYGEQRIKETKVGRLDKLGSKTYRTNAQTVMENLAIAYALEFR